MRFLHMAMIVVSALSCIRAAGLQMMMLGETTTKRAWNRLFWGLLVDGSEFTARGLKFRNWRRICVALALAAILASVALDRLPSLTFRPS